ncbi:MAG: hypothetical protein C4333_04305 [Meiothermus sp.]
MLGMSLSALQNPPASGKTQVLIKDFEFQPRELKVKVGSTVTFTHQDAVTHSATTDDKGFDTGLLEQNQSKAIQFGQAAPTPR